MALLANLKQRAIAPQPEDKPLKGMKKGPQRVDGLAADVGDAATMVRLLNSLDADPRVYRDLFPLHISTIIRACERQLVLFAEEHVKPVQVPGGFLRIIWELGLAAEKHVVTNVVKAAHQGSLTVYGKWVCEHSHHDKGKVGLYRADRMCVECGKPQNVYAQFAISGWDGKVTGSPDLMLINKNDMVVPVEIKSKQGDMFKAMIEPEADHILQVVAYQRLLAHNGVNVSNEAQIWYVSKAPSPAGSPYKIFKIKITQDMKRSVDALIDEVVGRVTTSLQNKTLPPREICASSDCTMARNCPVAVSCFNRGG